MEDSYLRCFCHCALGFCFLDKKNWCELTTAIRAPVTLPVGVSWQMVRQVNVPLANAEDACGVIL